MNRSLDESPASIADTQTSPAYFADLPDPALLAHEQDPQIPVLFKSLLKRDSTTRERALSDLATVFKSPSSPPKPSLQLLASWTQIHAKLALDVSPSIRATTHRIHLLLFAAALKQTDAKKYKSTAAKLLKLSAGPWTVALYDTDRVAAAEARAALDALFPIAAGKQDAFFGAFAALAIVSYAQDILLHQSTESLSDTRYVTPEDARSKRERALRGAISALAALVDHHSPLPDPATEALLQLVDDSAFWKLPESSGPTAARAFLHALPKILKVIPHDLLVQHQKDIFSAFIKKPLNDTPENSSLAPTEIIQALLALSQVYPAIWAFFSDKKKSSSDKLSSKAGISYLAKYIKKVSSKSPPPSQFWHLLMALLLQIPDPYTPFSHTDSPVALQSTQTILESVSAAVLALPLNSPPKVALRGTTSTDQFSPAAHAWSFYFALVEKVAQAEIPRDQLTKTLQDALAAFGQALATTTSVSPATIQFTIVPIAQRISNTLLKSWPDVVLPQIKETVMASTEASDAVRISVAGYLTGLASPDSSALNAIVVDYATALLKANSKALEPLLNTFPDILAAALQTDLEALANSFFTSGFADASADDILPIIRSALSVAHINVSISLATPRLVAFTRTPTPEYYRAVARVFSFHKALDSLDATCSELAEAVSASLLTWLENPVSHESQVLEAITAVVLAHDKISSSAQAQTLVDKLVDRLIDLEQDQSNPKLCTKIITSLTDLRKADAPFMLDYAQSTKGKATLARLWQLAETEALSATETSSTIESLIAQLDFFSFVSAPDYTMSSEVLLKVAADLRAEAIAAPGTDLGIVVQRAAGLIEQAPESQALAAFEGLLFPQQSWDEDALAPIIAAGVPAKLRISQTFGSAVSQLDDSFVSNNPAAQNHLIKLIKMATFASNLANTFPDLYTKASPLVKQAAAHGLYLADALLRVYFSITPQSADLADVIPAVLKDAAQFKHSVESQVDLAALFDVISPKPTGEHPDPLLLVVKSFWAQATGDDAQAFYAYVVLESLLEATLTSESAIDPTQLKKLVPMSIKNKLGALALLQALNNNSSTLVSQSFSVLRNNLVGDLITGPAARMHEKPGVYNLSLLALALYSAPGTTPNVAVPIFKLINLVARASTLFDDVYDPEYAPFVIQLGHLLVALIASFPASELPTESFWGPVSEFLGAAITAASANVGSEDDAEETYYAQAILKSSFTLANVFMGVYTEIQSPEIDENLETAYTLFVDTITVFYENERRKNSVDQLDLEFSQPLLEFVSSQTERPSSGLSKTLAGNAVEISAFYPMFASPNPRLQQLGLVVVSTHVRACQKDRALAFATIPHPSPEEIEANLLPIELVSLANFPLDFSLRKNITLDIKEASQYLFAWYVIFQYFDESVFSLRKLFLEQLAESESVLSLLGFVERNLNSMLRGPEKSWDITAFDIHVQLSENRSRLLLWHILFQALNHAGFVCKTWFNTQLSHGLKKDAKTVIANYISPMLIKTEVAGVRKYIEQLKARGDDDEDGVLEGTEISISRNNKTITLQLLFESEAIEAAFIFPDEYPLQDVRFEGLQRLGVPERQWRAWILFSQTMLLNHSGTIATAIELFKRNVGMYFAGFTECSICYTILQEDKSLPTRECTTCHNKFHGLCLSRWFKSGNTDSCPLCRTEHAFK